MMSAPYLPKTIICPKCSNPLPIGKPDPEWHKKCKGYRK